jgi:hypothetical protein
LPQLPTQPIPAVVKGKTIQLYFLGAEDAAIATGFILDKVRLLAALKTTT